LGQTRDKVFQRGKDLQLAIVPVKTLDMKLSVADQARTARPSKHLSLQPMLYTVDGPLINAAYRGTSVSHSAQENLGATATLAANDGRTHGTNLSGFA
jgi:hypothetical protein